MSQDFVEGALTFKFPDGWKICRAELSDYYRRSFAAFCSTVQHAPGCPITMGSKEMDFAAYDPATATLWLIEVKDFRHGPWRKTLGLIDQIALKTRDMLALLTVAAIVDQIPNAPPAPPEGQNWQAGEFGRSVQGSAKIRVALHCELQPVGSVLFPNPTHAANLAMKLKQMLQPVDRAAVLTTLSSPAPGLPWQVI